MWQETDIETVARINLEKSRLTTHVHQIHAKSLTFRSNNLLQLNNIGMIQSLQNLNLPNRRKRESILLFFRIDSFEGDYFTSLFIGSYKDTP
jgi:hypothetical protein